MPRIAKLLVTALFFLFLVSPPALADDIVVSLGQFDGLSVEDQTAFEQLRVDGWGTVITLKGGDFFKIEDNAAVDLLRLEDDGSLYKDGQLFLHTPATDNLFLGRLAGNTSLGYAYGNLAVGLQNLSSNTDGNRNTAVGQKALKDNTGSDNSALGYTALFYNTSGERNSAFGMFSAGRVTVGNDNAAFGHKSLEATTTGSQNTAVGAFAFSSGLSGSNNTAIGFETLSGLTGGSNRNIAIGSGAGSAFSSGDDNIYIGNVGSGSFESDTIRIGNTAHAKTYVDGIYGATSASGVAVYINSSNQLGTATSSARFKDSIRDMAGTGEALMKLRPVTFRYREEHGGSDRLLQYGLIAEEVAQVDPGLVAYDENGEPYSVRYQFLAPMLLNEYQRQQQVVVEQSAQLAELGARLERLEERLR